MHELFRFEAIILSPSGQKQTHVLVRILLRAVTVLGHYGARETDKWGRHVSFVLCAVHELFDGIVVSSSENEEVRIQYTKMARVLLHLL